MLRLGAATDLAGIRYRACPDSFPLVRSAGRTEPRQRRGIFLAADETGGRYAPLCPDGRRLDLRRLQECPGVTCWVEKIQVNSIRDTFVSISLHSLSNAQYALCLFTAMHL